MEGMIAHYDPRGFGFVSVRCSGVPDFYFESRDVIGEPVRKRDEVSFWLDESPNRRGLVAVEVQRRSAASNRR